MISDIKTNCCKLNHFMELLHCDYLCNIHIKTGYFEIVTGNQEISVDVREWESYDAFISEYLRERAVTECLLESISAVQIGTVIKNLETEQFYTYEIDIKEQGEIRRKQLRYTYADRNEGLIVQSCTDIEDIVRRERKKADRLEQELAQLKSENETKSEFWIHMCHDIRTSISGVNGIAVIAREECTEEKVQNYLENIEMTSKFFLGLLNDTLDMARIESGNMVLKREILCLHELNDSIYLMFLPILEKQGISYQYKNNYHRDYVYADKVCFQQIFFNLISNAIKYTLPGGTVTFSQECIRCDGQTEWVRFQVADTGIGMSREFLERAFEPFERERIDHIDKTWHGAGLGLPIVKKLVRMMHGILDMQSEQGKGTVVTVELPLEIVLNEEYEQKEQKEKREMQDGLLQGKRVLVVEDNDINLLVAEYILEKNGLVVETAGNGKEALEAVQNNHENYYDAILMDVRMPVKSGLDAARGIRAMARRDVKKIPIIAMSANAYEEDLEKSFRAGMNAHVVKPIEPELLIQTLADCMA